MPKAQATRTKSVCRVLLADDQAIFRAGIARVLAAEPDITIIGQCGHAENLSGMLAHGKTDILLLAQSLQAEPAHILAAACSEDTRIVLLVENNAVTPGNSRWLYGRITRQTSADELLTCVRRVHEGERVLAGTRPEGSHSDRIRDSLSARELQIVGLIVHGCKNRQIAEEIGTSEQVIKNHLRTIYDKTGSSDRLELALFTLHNRSLAQAAARAIDSHKSTQT